MAKNFRQYKIAETVSIIAHQLKHPIAIIRGYLEALLSEDLGKVNEGQKEYLNDALLNVKRISDTVDNFITVSMIEEGKYKLDLKPADLEKIISEVLSSFYYWAKASNCKIEYEKPKKLPLVLTDPAKIKQVIDNFLSNAIKYSSGQGIIKVALFLKSKEVIFSCKDNGISIPKEDFKKVFTKFYRSEKAMKVDPFGSGLGLYINKAIITLSGGKIWFSKNKGKGMTFSFSLPIAKNA